MATLIHINQYNTDKQILEKKIADVDKKVPEGSGLVTTNFVDTKIKGVENKILNVSDLVKKADYDTKISDIEGKYSFWLQ